MLNHLAQLIFDAIRPRRVDDLHVGNGRHIGHHSQQPDGHTVYHSNTAAGWNFFDGCFVGHLTVFAHRGHIFFFCSVTQQRGGARTHTQKMPVAMDAYEPILMPSNRRFVLSSIQYPDVWAMYKRAEASFWTAEEFDPASDLIDWNERMNDSERFFVKHILAFFAGADGVVNENLCENFAVQVQLYEARAFYGFQIAMEQIHSETYGLLIDAYVRDAVERDRLFNAMETIPCVTEKIEWALRWISNKEVGFAERLVAFATIEGVFFSGSFCAIFWLKKRGLMPGLTFTNELISRDENMHCEFACLLYSKLEHKLDAKIVLDIVCEAVDVETRFICTSLPVRLIGMNSDSMSQYIRYVADRLITQLGYEAHYKVTNPYEFMELQSLEGKTNFFEKRVGDYQKAGVLTGERGYGVDEDF